MNHLIVRGSSPSFIIKNFDLLEVEGYPGFLKCLMKRETDRVFFPEFKQTINGDCSWLDEKGWKPEIKKKLKGDCFGWRDFVLSHTAFVLEEWDYHSFRHNDVIFYSPSSEEELMYILNKKGLVNHSCYIGNQSSKDLANSSYFLSFHEHMMDSEVSEDSDNTDEYWAAFVTEYSNGSFISEVMPKLRKEGPGIILK